VEEDINVVDFEIYAEGKKQMIGSRGMAWKTLEEECLMWCLKGHDLWPLY
jgi:hypothetical protein